MMQALALHFYIENPSGLTADLIQILVHDLLSSKQREELEAYTRDFLTCSFLMRQGDSYTFSHRSLIEYLSAKSLLEEIVDETPNKFGRRLLTEEVIDFLCEMNPPRNVLNRWIQDTRFKEFETVGYLGSNSVMLLNTLGEVFDSHDLSGTILNNARLKSGKFKGVIFAQSSLSNADLSEANLNECNFTGANLTKTKLVCAKIRQGNFREACLEFTDFTRADISGSDFTDSLCYQTEFNDAIAKSRLIGFSMAGVLNPGISLRLQTVNIAGEWIGDGINAQLFIKPKGVLGITGKLELSKHSWIKVEGSFREAQYSLTGIEMSHAYKITSKTIKSLSLKFVNKEIRNNLRSLEGITILNRDDFIRNLRQILGSELRLKKNYGIENPMKFWDSIVEAARITTNVGQCVGWLRLPQNTDSRLLMHLEGGSKKSSPNAPWVFIRSARHKRQKG
jgi:uncharacterized protein YjbI with pentapeptide repeats